jgi:hypothetical protein
VPWEYEVQETADGVGIILRDGTAAQRSLGDRVRAEIRVTLPKDRSYFVVEPTVENPTAETHLIQFWLNAALTLGSASTSLNTEFVFPTDRMIVHSTGDAALPGERQTMSWPVHDGRDFSAYGNWRNWLGVFVPEVAQDYVGAYNYDTSLGLARIFPAETVHGLKLFAFGAGFPARAEYSDDGTDYFEIWAGPCRTFWPEDDLRLVPGESMHWSEIWWPVFDTGGIDEANSEVAARAAMEDDRLTVSLASSTPRMAHLYLSWDGSALYQGSVDLAPEKPLRIQVGLPEGATLTGELDVHVTDQGATTLLHYVKGLGSSG